MEPSAWFHRRKVIRSLIQYDDGQIRYPFEGLHLLMRLVPSYPFRGEGQKKTVQKRTWAGGTERIPTGS